MALQNTSAALRMSMPEIIRQYLQTFALRRELDAIRSLSSLRKLPRWLPLREMLVRRRTQRILSRSAALKTVSIANQEESSQDWEKQEQDRKAV
jgi:hypothetical protein